MKKSIKIFFLFLFAIIFLFKGLLHGVSQAAISGNMSCQQCLIFNDLYCEAFLAWNYECTDKNDSCYQGTQGYTPNECEVIWQLKDSYYLIINSPLCQLCSLPLCQGLDCMTWGVPDPFSDDPEIFP